MRWSERAGQRGPLSRVVRGSRRQAKLVVTDDLLRRSIIQSWEDRDLRLDLRDICEEPHGGCGPRVRLRVAGFPLLSASHLFDRLRRCPRV
jgi:hypothetical protein